MKKFVLVLLLTAGAMACRRAADLPQLYPTPAASLVDMNGKPVSLDSMRGSVVIYDFIYTRCGATCPLMTRAMKRVTEKIDRDLPVRFVSITVDPDYDTPAVLRSYSAKNANDPRWTFLTGEKEHVLHASIDGFKLAAGTPASGSAEQMIHSTRFVLVDRKGMIRGYYDALGKDTVKHLVRDAQLLAKE